MRNKILWGMGLVVLMIINGCTDQDIKFLAGSKAKTWVCDLCLDGNSYSINFKRNGHFDDVFSDMGYWKFGKDKSKILIFSDAENQELREELDILFLDDCNLHYVRDNDTLKLVDHETWSNSDNRKSSLDSSLIESIIIEKLFQLK